MVSKSESEGQVKSRIGDTQFQNNEMKGEVEHTKEKIHLLQLQNNQLSSEIKRQRTINQAR